MSATGYVDFAAYKAIDAVNWSSLKHMRKSPKHYHYWRHREIPDSPRMEMGRAVHTAILEPGRFEMDCCVFPGEVRRGKAWDEFQSRNQSRTILRQDEYDRCLAISEAVRSHPVARSYLSHNAEYEKTLQWTDPDTGLNCKARIDVLSAALVDLKSTGDVDARNFGNICARMGYHLQFGFYRWGLEVCEGIRRPVVIIAVEQDPPHDVVVYSIGDDELFAGLEECRDLLRKVHACEESGRWPGRSDEERLLSLPTYIFRDDDDPGHKVLTFGGHE